VQQRRLAALAPTVQAARGSAVSSVALLRAPRLRSRLQRPTPRRWLTHIAQQLRMATLAGAVQAAWWRWHAWCWRHAAALRPRSRRRVRCARAHACIGLCRDAG
jgi:hypothetical protein